MSGVPTAPPRTLRGRSWREVEFAALDFETTGLDLARDHIVSFGVVPIRDARIPVGELVYREVSPPAAPSPVSVSVHGLRPIDLATAPSIGAERETLRSALHHRYIVAWAAEVESAFLAATFGRSSAWWRRRIIDTRVLVRAVERGREHRGSLSDTAARFGVPVDDPHHALDDALTTAELFLALATAMSERRVATPRTLLRRGRAGRLPGRT
jgi:DNA polymerase-3 subunit epsilon